MQVIVTKSRKKIFEVSSTGVQEVQERTVLDGGSETGKIDEELDCGNGSDAADYKIDCGH